MRRSNEMLGFGSSRTFSSSTLRYAPVSDGGSVCSSIAMCVTLGCLSARTLSNNRRARTVCACSRSTVCALRLAISLLIRNTRAPEKKTSASAADQLGQARVAGAGLDAAGGHQDGAGLGHQHEQLRRAGQAGIDEIAGQ